MCAASGLDLLQHYQDFSGENAWVLLTGFVTSYIAAWLVMKVFLAFLNRFTFNAFGIYRIIFGFILLGWMYL